MADLFNTTNIRSGEPEMMFVGDLVRWRRTDISDTYDPTLYDLNYSMRKLSSSAEEIEITATSDSTGFYVDVATATSALWAFGEYSWVARVVRKSDSESITVARGRIKVMRDLGDLADTSDPRSHARKMVDMLEATLENRAPDDIVYYMIGGRAVSKIPPRELRELLSQYRAELSAEEAAVRRAEGKPSRDTLIVRFTE